MRVGILYKLDFASGKSYIGITRCSFKVRFGIHRNAALRGSPHAVCRAWRKHGEPVGRVLAIVEEHMLLETEKKAVAQFKTKVPHGYNMTDGGDSAPLREPEIAARQAAKIRGRPRPVEVRMRISAAHLGKTLTAEHRAKLSAAQLKPETVALKSALNMGAKNPQFGTKWSDERRAHHSAFMKGKPKSAEHRANMSRARRGMKFGPEARANMAAAARRRYQKAAP